MMKKCFTLLASLWLVCGNPLALAADIPVTIYADAGYQPYSYADANGKAAGLYAEIVKAAFARMQGYRIDIKPVPWKRGMAMLKNGTGFALYPPYMNLKEEPFTWPYSLPLFEEIVVAVCTKEVAARPRPRWPEDFYGLRIGNNAGFLVGGDAFNEAVKTGKLKMEDAADTRTNILKLGMKRIDCYINDRISIRLTQNQLIREGKLPTGPAGYEAVVIAREQGFLGFTDRDDGRFPYKTDFLKQFDAIIYDMRRTGEIERIAHNFFKGK
ncbi:MAG TPA: transporter substrate-binding domain-containing protein [Telluria sp.]|jgi:polar amino acid transport system substrate-binding protein